MHQRLATESLHITQSDEAIHVLHRVCRSALYDFVSWEALGRFRLGILANDLWGLLNILKADHRFEDSRYAYWKTVGEAYTQDARQCYRLLVMDANLGGQQQKTIDYITYGLELETLVSAGEASGDYYWAHHLWTNVFRCFSANTPEIKQLGTLLERMQRLSDLYRPDTRVGVLTHSSPDEAI